MENPLIKKEEWYTCRELLNLLEVSETILSKIINSGCVEKRITNAVTFYRGADIINFIESHK